MSTDIVGVILVVMVVIGSLVVVELVVVPIVVVVVGRSEESNKYMLGGHCMAKQHIKIVYIIFSLMCEKNFIKVSLRKAS